MTRDKCKEHNFDVQKSPSGSIFEICTRCGLQVEYVPKQSNPDCTGASAASGTHVAECPICKTRYRHESLIIVNDIRYLDCPYCGNREKVEAETVILSAEGGPAKENVWPLSNEGKEEFIMSGLDHLIDKHPIQTFTSGAVRVDENTPAYSYIPICALRRLAYIYKEGEQHYPGFNWRKGIPTSNIIDHALEHLNKWLEGNRTEDHLSKVMWAMATLIYYEEQHILDDDLHWPTKQ